MFCLLFNVRIGAARWPSMIQRRCLTRPEALELAVMKYNVHCDRGCVSIVAPRITRGREEPPGSPWHYRQTTLWASTWAKDNTTSSYQHLCKIIYRLSEKNPLRLDYWSNNKKLNSFLACVYKKMRWFEYRPWNRPQFAQKSGWWGGVWN